MSRFEQLVEQQVRFHEAHRLHLDEVPLATRPPVTLPPDEGDRAWEIDEVRNAGPMGVWDALAIQVEHALERLVH